MKFRENKYCLKSNVHNAVLCWELSYFKYVCQYLAICVIDTSELSGSAERR